jgi:hypothetical protein
LQLLDMHQERIPAFDRAKHIFCKHCGIHPFYVPRSDPDKIDVNVRCLDDIDLAAISPKPFDGKEWEASMRARVPWR